MNEENNPKSAKIEDEANLPTLIRASTVVLTPENTSPITNLADEHSLLPAPTERLFPKTSSTSTVLISEAGSQILFSSPSQNGGSDKDISEEESEESDCRPYKRSRSNSNSSTS